MTILLDGAVLNTVELRETVNKSAARVGKTHFGYPAT